MEINKMIDSKQVIVAVRGHMPEGKLASQVAHAAVANVLNMQYTRHTKDGVVYLTLTYPENSPEQYWMEKSFTKIVLGVDTREEMFDIYNKAKEAGLNVSLIIDNGQTVFDGVETPTCVAIGPHADELIDPVTRHLSRY